MVIILVGNPVDGFAAVGPFDSGPDAVAFGERYYHGVDEASWWITNLDSPAELDKYNSES